MKIAISHRSALVLACLALLLGAPPALGASCPAAPFVHFAEPGQLPNLGELKLQLIDYKCFGGYDRDVAKALAEARVHVETRASAVPNPAIVLDIDETSLSNWTEILADDFGYIPDGECSSLPNGPCGDRAWELSAQAPALAPTLALFNAAKARGVAIFFITGRSGDEALRAATEKNLRAAGYEGWTELVMRPAGSHTASAADYKAPERAKIATRFTIIANIGDQKSDLDGGYAERSFRVPNPFYYIP